MYYFTTYFDRNYLSRGLILYESIKEYCDQFELYILCLDNFTKQYFESNASQFKEIKIISLEEIEQYDVDLKKCKQNRNTIEYYFTLSPCLPLYLLKIYLIPHICSLDADILILNKVNSLFDYLNKYSIVVTPHKYSKEVKSKEEIYGVFNVSFQIFKNDSIGISCLEKWREQCIDWCGDYEDEKNNRYADQKYLDEWPKLYNEVLKILDDNISGLASWNLNNYQISNIGNRFYSNNERIIFYHFDAFKFFNSRLSTNGFVDLKIRKQKAIHRLYIFYWRKLVIYNQILSLEHDQSTRRKSSNNILIRALFETSLYFRISNRSIIIVNYKWVPTIIKTVLIKLIKCLN
jgi:hypothetical protein